MTAGHVIAFVIGIVAGMVLMALMAANGRDE